MIEKLRKIIDCEVFTDPIRTGLLATDGSIFQIRPKAVVYPATVEDVIKTVMFAGNNGFSVHPRGAGSGLCGSALGGGIVIDFSKYMNRLIRLDIGNKWMECEPGYRLGELEAALDGKGLFFPPDPSSGEYATLGGMYATNASGAHSVKYGNVADYILDADAVLSNGKMITFSECFSTSYEKLPVFLQEIHDLYTSNQNIIEKSYPDIRCNTTGYNLRKLVKDGRLDLSGLFAGAEGTLCIVTRLKVRLLDKPLHDSLVVAFFDDILSSARAVQEILPLGPSGIEIMDKSLLNLARENDSRLKNYIPEGVDNVLLVEFDSYSPDICSNLANETRQLLESGGYTNKTHLAVTAHEKGKFWAIRKAAVPILYKLKGEKKIIALIEDAAVPTDRLVDYFQGIYAILNSLNVSFVVYGHIAKGLLHTRPLLNLKDKNDIRLLKPISDSVFELINSLGGAVSGEHGDGRLRSAYIRRQYPAIFPIFMELRNILDPKRLFNPDIISPANTSSQIQQNLRLGEYYEASYIPEKKLLWPEGFTDEVEKCHGCSKCTTVTTATRMCPVYKITRDEAAAPKAKANVLRMLISGKTDRAELYEASFQEVISRCIHCGSCFQECPSGVNIPKMAAEARSEYVTRFGASIHEKIVVNAEFAGRRSGILPEKVSTLLNIPVIRTVSEMLTGISSRRKQILPSRKSLFDRIPVSSGEGTPKILYFAGCFAAYFRPYIAEATISVLTSMGMNVIVPRQFCCGLPMLSKGMAKEALNKIEKNFRNWGSLLESVDHLAVSCSSCGLAMLAEWGYLADTVFVRKVKEKIIPVSGLVNMYSERLETLSSVGSHLFYHLPCHLKVQPEPSSSIQMLSRLSGVVIDSPVTNCCGMAGTWGLSKDNFDLSLDIGSDMAEKFNSSSADTGITDCPTCAIQMEHSSDKPVYHPIEIVARQLTILY